MDQEGTDGEKLLKELRKRFGENVVPFVDIMTESDCPGGKVYLHTKEGAVEEVLEELAVCEDDMMEEYLEEEGSLWIKYKSSCRPSGVSMLFWFGTTFSRRGRTFGWT